MKNHIRIIGLSICLLWMSGCSDAPVTKAISADGVEVSFNVTGKGDPALVFIHGWCNDKSVWDDQMEYFSEAHKVVAIDLPGSGASGTNRENWTIEAFAGDVAAVIEALKLKEVVLVGFSMGGPVSIETAAMELPPVKGIVLVDNIHDIDMQYTPEFTAFMDSLYRDIVNFPGNEKLMALGFYRNNPDSSFARIESMFANLSIPTWERSLPNLIRWLDEDARATLQQVKIPVRAIISDLRPTNSEAMSNYAGDFDMAIIPNTAHLIMWDNPEGFNTALEEYVEGIVQGE
jgi:pimeloyl-ACP methyl ester carboxylesterase